MKVWVVQDDEYEYFTHLGVASTLLRATEMCVDHLGQSSFHSLRPRPWVVGLREEWPGRHEARVTSADQRAMARFVIFEQEVDVLDG